MKISILLFTLFISSPGFAATPYVTAVRSKCHKTADQRVRAGMTRFQILWANFFSENLGARPIYLKTYAACMLKTSARSAVAARDRQELNLKNMLANLHSKKIKDIQITEISGKSTVCSVNSQNPEKFKILRRGYDYIGRIANNHQFDWYWEALETFVQSTEDDRVRAFGFCRFDPIK